MTILMPPAANPVTRYPLERAMAAADTAGPTEGDMLRAALAAYGIPSFAASWGGVSYLLVAVDHATDEGDAEAGLRLVISSGEDAARPAEEHDEPWSAQLCAPDDDWVGEVFRAPVGLTTAEESAVTAWALARWLDREGPALLELHPRPVFPLLGAVDDRDVVDGR
ncbi:hypothetical protein [Streptomyces xantholiticus]|uniref:Uncharacterized protein n=1 Tax=Streptomyces xantholiticus TaxID=68285 RepID=A0ABV1V089_9ACTN